MKKLLIITLFLSGFGAFAQNSPEIRLDVLSGYVFNDRVSTAYYNGTVKGSFQWGGKVEYLPFPGQGIELSYLRQDTKAPTYYQDGGTGGNLKSKVFDLAVNYIMLGTTRYIRVNPMLEPYLGAQLGIGVVGVSNPTNGISGTVTKFAWGVNGGLNLWVSPRVGIKLNAGLNSVAQAVGGGLYFGTGGVSTGLSTYSTVLQFSLGGGLVFKFGNGI